MREANAVLSNSWVRAGCNPVLIKRATTLPKA